MFTLFLTIFYTIPLQAQDDSGGCNSFDDCGIWVEDHYAGNSSGGSYKDTQYTVNCPDRRYGTDDYPSLPEAKLGCGITDHLSPSASVVNESAIVKDNSECVITGNSVNVRSGPSTDFEPAIGALNTGIELIATGQNNGWFNVTYNGQSAWVAGSAVDATGDICSELPFVEAPDLPVTTSSDSATSSELEGVSCLNFQRLSPPASGIARTAVDFSWSVAEGAGTYELVIYDFANNPAGTFRTEQTMINVNLGELPLGQYMSWEVRAFAPDGAYACVTFNSGAITIQADPNPQPVETDEPPVETDEPPVETEISPAETEECDPGSLTCGT
ncbi:MAG: hypothetical protein Phog2KO_13410 [Phototrophicaceae bacterium]